MLENQLKTIINDFKSKTIPSLTPRKLALYFIEGSSLSIVGARRSGKSYRTYQLMSELIAGGLNKENICRIQFNDHRLSQINSTQLSLIDETFYGLYPNKRGREIVYFIFDEIHRIDNWEDYILYLLEDQLHKVIITGSTSKLLKGNLASQLRGKNFSVTLFPFSFEEFVNYQSTEINPTTSSGKDILRKHFHHYLDQGGFPGLLGLNSDLHIDLLQSYWDSMIIKDIIEAHPKDKINIATFNTFTSELISRVSCPLTINKIKINLKGLGLKFSANSFYNYLQYLEEAFIIFPVYFFSKSNAIKNRNPMKIYCIDWALALAVMPGGELDVTRRLENMVFLELKRRGYDVYYYKTLKDHEIDFIAVSKRDKSKILIQVCYSIEKSDVRERETRGIAETCEFLKINNAQIITANEEDSINLKSVTVKVSPFWKWALEK